MLNGVLRELNVDKVHYLVIMTPFCQVLGPLGETFGGNKSFRLTLLSNYRGGFTNQSRCLHPCQAGRSNRQGGRSSSSARSSTGGMGWDGMLCSPPQPAACKQRAPGSHAGKGCYSISETHFSLLSLCLVITALC